MIVTEQKSYMDKKLKILHAPCNPAGQIGILSCAQWELAITLIPVIILTIGWVIYVIKVSIWNS